MRWILNECLSPLGTTPVCGAVFDCAGCLLALKGLIAYFQWECRQTGAKSRVVESTAAAIQFITAKSKLAPDWTAGGLEASRRHSRKMTLHSRQANWTESRAGLWKMPPSRAMLLTDVSLEGRATAGPGEACAANHQGMSRYVHYV